MTWVLIGSAAAAGAVAIGLWTGKWQWFWGGMVALLVGVWWLAITGIVRLVVRYW